MTRQSPVQTYDFFYAPNRANNQQSTGSSLASQWGVKDQELAIVWARFQGPKWDG